MKTEVKEFYFEVGSQIGKIKWRDFEAERANEGLIRSNTVHPTFASAIVGKEVEIETDYLFADQWNATVAGGGGFRLADFSVFTQGNVREGYYLVMTDEMREVRKNRHICGYCGRQYNKTLSGMIPVKDGKAYMLQGEYHCLACCGSEHLTEAEAKLTKLCSLASKQERPEIDEAVKTFILREGENQYRRRLTSGEHNEAGREARKEYVERIEVIDWLAGRGMASHSAYRTEKGWKFGWMTPIQPHLEQMMHELLRTFPFRYLLQLPNDRIIRDPREN